MQRISGAFVDLTDPLKPKFRNPDAQQGTQGTQVTAAWLNDIQENLAAFIEQSGLALTPDRAEDLADAIRHLLNGSSEAFAKLAVDVAGADAEIAFTTEQNAHMVLELTGARTADLIIAIPAMAGITVALNSTTGGHAVKVKVTGQPDGTAVPLPAGVLTTFVSDGVTAAPVITDQIGVTLDGNGDLPISTGSIWTTSSDTDFGAGGNRVVMDQAGGLGRVGSVAGGGTAVQLQIHNAGIPILTTDVGSNVKNLQGATRFTEGHEQALQDLGTLPTGTTNLSWTGKAGYFAHLGGDVTLNFQNPDAGYFYPKMLIVRQDGTGGRDLSIQRDGGATQIHWLTPELNWPAQAALEASLITVIHDAINSRLLLAAKGGIWS